MQPNRLLSMKRNVFLLFLLLICQYGIGQQYIRLSDGTIVTDSHITTLPTRTVEEVKDGILVTYEFNYLYKKPDNLFPSSSVLFIDGFGVRRVPEEPALPIKWDVFYVPSEKDYSIDIIDSSYIELPIEIAPARQPMLNGEYSYYTTDNVLPIKPYEGVYPQNTINSRINIYRTYPILDICINPIRYNYQQKRVVICKKLSYIINMRGEKDSKNIVNNTEFHKDPLLANIIMNPRKKIENKEVNQVRSATQITTPKYLIITVPKFSEAVNKLADWKRTLGYNVQIETQTVWDSVTVKSTVVNSNPNYLLLFGDFEDIPGRFISRTIPVLGGHKTINFYTDYYYGCINQDTYPDIHRGRISASSLTEANTIVDKIINYERKPITDASFYKTGIHCAYFQDKNLDGVEDLRFTLTSEEIRDHMLQQGQNMIVNRVYCAPYDVTPMYWNVGDLGFVNLTPIPSELLKSNNFGWDGNSQNVKTGINNGVFYVFQINHGDVTEWTYPNFTTSHIWDLQNGNKLPVVFSMSCLTGKYNQGTCFAEAFLRKAGGGCVGIFAASERSFSGDNDALSLAMFEAIWPNPSFIRQFNSDSTLTFTQTPIYKLGDFFDQGLAAIHSIFPDGYDFGVTHTKEVFHCFGDPAMEMYTDVPTPFANVSITKNNGSTIVSVGENATITFFNRTTGTIESFYGNSVTYPNVNNIQVCISAHNKIPYIKEAGNFYIQNETISGVTTYHADQIIVGSNVTTLKPTGSVIISSGKTTLIGDTVELNGETTIESGAELEIKN